MRYLLASDYDGTLYYNKEITERTREALSEWKRQGHIFCLCSGRGPKAALEEMKKGGIHPDLLITGNGSSAIDMDGNLRFYHPFPAARIKEMLDRAHEMGCSGFHIHDTDGELRLFDALRPERTNFSREEAERVTACSQFGAHFRAHPEIAAVYTEWVNTNLPDVTAHYNGANIDCTVRGVDKATGVAEAAKLFGIDLENCYTVGDNMNDLAMLLPYHGAVMATGNPETIKRVGRSTPSVADFICEILESQK